MSWLIERGHQAKSSFPLLEVPLNKIHEESQKPSRLDIFESAKHAAFIALALGGAATAAYIGLKTGIIPALVENIRVGRIPE